MLRRVNRQTKRRFNGIANNSNRHDFIFGLGVSSLRKQIIQEIKEKKFLSEERIDRLKDRAYFLYVGGQISSDELKKIYNLLNQNAQEGKGIFQEKRDFPGSI